MDIHANEPIPAYRSILIPLDGSTRAESALPAARAIAKRTGALLHLARVHTPSFTHVGAEFAPPNWNDSVRDGEREYLRRLAKVIFDEDGTRTECALLDGPIAKALVDHVKDVSADVIVLATHGRTGLSRAWLGSTADWLVRFAPLPAILVRAAEEAASEYSLRRVLVALDGSAPSELILPEIVRLTSGAEIQVTLLTVIAPTVDSGDDTLDAMLDVKTHLASLATRLHQLQPGLTVETEVVVDDLAGTAIIERATAMSADVVAMSTRGRGASRFLVGSVADHVLRRFSGALLLLGPVAIRERERTESGHAMAGAQ